MNLLKVTQQFATEDDALDYLRHYQKEMFTNLLKETASKKPMRYRELVNTF